MLFCRRSLQDTLRCCATFCEVNHGVTFPLVKKSEVNGDKTNEVYKWLKSEKSGILGLARIKVSEFITFLCFEILTEGAIVEFREIPR
jgi:glutathione peroxidase-family protein